jgi:hypothetical protein
MLSTGYGPRPSCAVRINLLHATSGGLDQPSGFEDVCINLLHTQRDAVRIYAARMRHMCCTMSGNTP